MFVDAGESNPALSLLKNALPLSYAPLPVFPGCQYQKQIIACLPPGGNILKPYPTVLLPTGPLQTSRSTTFHRFAVADLRRGYTLDDIFIYRPNTSLNFLSKALSILILIAGSHLKLSIEYIRERSCSLDPQKHPHV